jgi:hypothetical protein
MTKSLLTIWGKVWDISRAGASSFLSVISVVLPADVSLLPVLIPSEEVGTDCNPVRANAAAALMTSFFS